MQNFTVERLSFQHLAELPTAWDNADYKALLAKMDYDNPDEIDPAELKAMCQMSITDLEPTDAARLVLEYLFADELKEGQIDQLAHQLQTEKLWEENPRLELHEGFFNATQLLYEAYNGKFPRPQAVEFKVKVTTADGANLAVFDENPAAPLLRLLAPGLSDSALLHRLFGDQLVGTTFAEAPAILWQITPSDQTATSVVFDIIASDYWLEDFKYADTYEAPTHADAAVAEAE